uniref:Cytochrome c biogenesis protein CcsA n=1 Tax=Lobochlamys segnis TaxID=52035 RepID=A0A0S2ICZ4_9CHLO|nr:heme attachment to plastid cytochrome c [Lobochlamys segnis]
MYTKLEIFFGNISFVFLFCTMVYFWVNTAFFNNGLVVSEPIFLPLPSLSKGTGVSSPANFLSGSSANTGSLRDPSSSENVAAISSIKNPSLILMLLSNFSLAILLALRWINSGHFPLSNLYESLMFLSWSCTSIHFILLNMDYGTELSLKQPFLTTAKRIQSTAESSTLSATTDRSGTEKPYQEKQEVSTLLGQTLVRECSGQESLIDQTKQNKELQFENLVQPSEVFHGSPLPITNSSSEKEILHGAQVWRQKNLIQLFIGCITAPCAFLMNAYATLSLPKEMQEIAPLVPALQSNWLMMHVTVMIISYAALILGSLLSIAFLIITWDSVTPISSESRVDGNFSQASKGEFEIKFNSIPTLETSLNVSGQAPNFVQSKISKNLDNYSYRILGIGFPFLTIGILSGAVWANEAWGSYWSWDPKETWALLTWFVYAIYLHTRFIKGWEGKKPAIIASLGFLFVWICFLGVNLIGEGLHSYGWFSK